MVVDVARCTGCMTCVIACKKENHTGPGLRWNRVFELEMEYLDRIVYFRYGCMHCDHPPCVEACPEHAIKKGPDGIVRIDKEKCRGHAECMKACPYGVIGLNPQETYFQGPSAFEQVPEGPPVLTPGKASMCTLCVHRIKAGREPACVEGCPSGALIFGDLDDPDNPVSKRDRAAVPLLMRQGTEPNVRYIAEEDILKRMERTLSMP